MSAEKTGKNKAGIGMCVSCFIGIIALLILLNLGLTLFLLAEVC